MEFIAFGADDRASSGKPGHLEHLNPSGVANNMADFPERDLPDGPIVCAVIDDNYPLPDPEKLFNHAQPDPVQAHHDDVAAQLRGLRRMWDHISIMAAEPIIGSKCTRLVERVDPWRIRVEGSSRSRDRKEPARVRP